jgi:hypothetical protein
MESHLQLESRRHFGSQPDSKRNESANPLTSPTRAPQRLRFTTTSAAPGQRISLRQSHISLIPKLEQPLKFPFDDVAELVKQEIGTPL